MEKSRLHEYFWWEDSFLEKKMQLIQYLIAKITDENTEDIFHLSEIAFKSKDIQREMEEISLEYIQKSHKWMHYISQEKLEKLSKEIQKILPSTNKKILEALG